MFLDFLYSMKCVRDNEVSDYLEVLDKWTHRSYLIALMPAISWQCGIYNLFDQKLRSQHGDLIWIIPAGQADYSWIPQIRESITSFYDTDEIRMDQEFCYPEMQREEFEECILLYSDDLQDDLTHTVLGANVILVRLRLSSGRETLLLLLLDHQNNCWERILEKYQIHLRWYVDYVRDTVNHYVQSKLYQLMKHTLYPEILPALYFKSLFHLGRVPDGFRSWIPMQSQIDVEGYNRSQHFSEVYITGWNI